MNPCLIHLGQIQKPGLLQGLINDEASLREKLTNCKSSIIDASQGSILYLCCRASNLRNEVYLHPEGRFGDYPFDS